MQITCLPGLLCTPQVFDPVADLIGADRIVGLALPDEDNFAAMAAQLAEEVPQGAVLLGMSMGSYLAIDIVLRAPERISGLIVVGTSAAADSPKAAAMRAKVVAWAKREGIPALAASICDGMLGADQLADKNIRACVAEMAETIGLDVFARHQSALAGRPDNVSRLVQIACPTLVLTGSEDRVTPVDQGRATAAAIPQGRFREIDGAGHLAILEQPARVADEINRFLAEELMVESAVR